MKAGGFQGLYRGLIPAAVGSAPGAALFFGVYENSKHHLANLYQNKDGSQSNQNNGKSASAVKESGSAWIHMISAGIGECAACFVRVPTEVIKQNMQVMQKKIGGTQSQYHQTIETIRFIFRTEGIGGFYTGFFSTIIREIPFSFIQFPLYEYFKVQVSLYNKSINYITKSSEAKQLQISDSGHISNERSSKDTVEKKAGSTSESFLYQATPFQAALCGSVSGGIAAAITTPLDVVKTRLMIKGNAELSQVTGANEKEGLKPEATRGLLKKRRNGVVSTFLRILREEGANKLFSGIGPRTMWISIGGCIFFGAYEQSLSLVKLFS